ncbi:MAG: Gfo/Idh/MocA family oxidoreductase [Rhodospirillales bacterium]|nr:Gfo/Idh/MocA family oxidoreductase [Rhodospirillales bacterium]
MITLGIIGAGIMGERMARAALDQAADSVRVSGIWDPAAGAMARMGAELPAIPHAATPEALIAAADCVYVASPPATHLEHAARALAAGKAVFCEKPLAVDVAAASGFVAAHAGARAAVNFPMASSLAVATLRGWLDAGLIGAPRSLAIEVAFANWPRSWQRDAVGWLDGRAQGGFTREVVSHFLFLTRRLCGPMTLLAREASFPEAGRSERAISATLEAGGLPVSLSGGVGTTDKDDHNTWALTGEAGAIRLRDWSVAERQLPDGTWQPDPAAMPNERMRPVVLKRQLEGVARMTAGQPHHLATLQEAFEVQMAVERILAG